MHMVIPLAMVKTDLFPILLFIFVGFLVFISLIAALVLAIIALTRTSKNRREISDLKNTVKNMASS